MPVRRALKPACVVVPVIRAVEIERRLTRRVEQDQLARVRHSLNRLPRTRSEVRADAASRHISAVVTFPDAALIAAACRSLAVRFVLALVVSLGRAAMIRSYAARCSRVM